MGFDVVGVLGRGGATVVELAVGGNGERVAGKRVALTGSARQIEVARRRLRREAEVVRKLAHPGIVPILGVIDEDKDLILLFPVMAESLEDRVSRLGPLTLSEVTRIGQVLLSALATAHRHGVIHRDIKPSNVLFDEFGRPALSDFGAATSWELTSGLTPDGTVIGTPMWMAPEQARGEATSTASDVFSLGATLAYAATGREPYGSGPPAVVIGRAARAEIHELPASLPTELRIPLQCMLDPFPGRRPSAAAALGGLDGTIESPVPTLEERPARWPRRSATRRRALIGAAGAVVTLASVAVGVGISAEGSSPPHASSASEAIQAVPAPPHTRGGKCDPGWYDLNGVSADGCEAHSDYTAGVLSPDAPIHANLVPTSATDSFITHVAGDSLSLCWGSLHVTLTTPAQVAERLTVWKGATQVAEALSANGAPATATLKKPSCFGGDSEDLRVTVAAVASTGGASATDFTLSRDSGW